MNDHKTSMCLSTAAQSGDILNEAHGLPLEDSTVRQVFVFSTNRHIQLYRVILSVLGPTTCEYLKDYSLDFEHAYMTTYLAS